MAAPALTLVKIIQSIVLAVAVKIDDLFGLSKQLRHLRQLSCIELCRRNYLYIQCAALKIICLRTMKIILRGITVCFLSFKQYFFDVYTTLYFGCY